MAAALRAGAAFEPSLDAAAPNSAGFHQTNRNADARPITTAFSKKLMNERARRN
jgi:hypothetical protein